MRNGWDMSKTFKGHCFAHISVISHPFRLFLVSFWRVNPPGCGYRCARVRVWVGVELPMGYPWRALLTIPVPLLSCTSSHCGVSTRESLVPPALLSPASFVFFPTFSATGLEVVTVADAFHVRLFTAVLTEVSLIRNVMNVSPCYLESWWLHESCTYTNSNNSFKWFSFFWFILLSDSKTRSNELRNLMTRSIPLGPCWMCSSLQSLHFECLEQKRHQTFGKVSRDHLRYLQCEWLHDIFCLQ